MQFWVYLSKNWANGLTERITRGFSVGGRSILIASLLATSLLTSAKKLGMLEPLELFSFDHLIRLQPNTPRDSRLLIVGMTEEDIQQSVWPISDQKLARLLQTIQRYEPKVIGLTFYHNNPRSPGHSELVTQLKADNLIAIMNVGNDPDLEAVPPPPTIPWERIGFNDLVIDADGVLRRSLLFVSSADRPYYSFALRVTLVYLSNLSPTFKYDHNSLYIENIKLERLERETGGYQTVDNSGYQILLRYRARQTPAQQLTVSQVLNDRFNPELIRGKVVLVGTTAPSLKDQYYTPYSANQGNQFTMSGVVIHAQIISQLLDAVAGENVLFRFLPEWGETLWLWGWTLIAGGIVWQGKRPVFVFCAGGLILLGLWGMGWLGFTHLIWLPIAEPMVGVLVSGSLITTQKLLYNSTHDELTGLPDRDVFIQHIHRALQSNQRRQQAQPVVVAFLDIDRFKLINQSLGHLAGDLVLLTVVDRLQQVVPQSVQLARVGGDEFAILFQDMTRGAIGKTLETLQITLSEPFYLDQQRLSTTVSVGMVIIQDNYLHKPENLLRDAHTAMYRAKALGKFRYEVFATGMLDEAVNRLRLESDLLDALENQEFLLYYQPIVCLKTGHIEGFEALARWRRQDQGFVLPGAFIPVTEEIGLIMSLGQWIFQAACRQLKLWQQQFPNYPLKMSINLSKRQFEQPDLVNQIATILQDVGVNGHCIWLELTESMVMGEVEEAIDLMLRLKGLGLRLSIDDFGTGYSSLSYLHRFPMDTLKVDKSFVGHMEQSSEDWEIVDTIIALGHKLGMDVVAEGVETLGQTMMLKQAYCEYGQGYFFSKPLSSEEATTLLTQKVNSSSMFISHNEQK